MTVLNIQSAIRVPTNKVCSFADRISDLYLRPISMLQAISE